MNLKELNEARDLYSYKLLLNMLGEFTERNPGTAVSKMYKQVLAGGISCMPKDKQALVIIQYVLSELGTPKALNDLMNTNFSELPITNRPLYATKDKKNIVAFWCKGGKLYSRVIDLLSFEGETGKWSDEKCGSVTLTEKE